MSKIDATVLKDGQLAIATFEQSGTLISGASAIDTTCLVQTEDGVQQCVKTFPLGEGGGGGGTSDYSDLSNKPQINGTTLSGNKSSSDLGVSDTSLSNLTAAGKEVASSLSFPGDSRISLTVPQPQELITATSDGYMVAGTSAESMQLFVFPSTATSMDDDAMTNTVFAASSIQAARGSVCIRKGQKFAYTTSDNSSLSWLRFCPSKGSEPQQ